LASEGSDARIAIEYGAVDYTADYRREGTPRPLGTQLKTPIHASPVAEVDHAMAIIQSSAFRKSKVLVVKALELR
jgi:hypothetical protein